MIALLLICVVLLWFFVRWHFANAVASKIDVRRPESKLVIDTLIGFAPTDPQTHYAAAAVLEKTFDPGDLERSLIEYEKAAALSPNNFQMWINLGRARNLVGDVAGAEVALKRALELAPNYSAVQWAFGNFLIRQGRTDEGFALAAQAAERNADLAGSAVSIALQIFEGDVAQVRQMLGEGALLNAALATSLASEERFDDAVESWSRLPANAKTGEFQKLGEKLFDQLTAAKKYQLAVRVFRDLEPESRPEVGIISNGGFEDGVKRRGARVFEWQIGDGAEPQIGLSESQKRSGKFGLFIVFNSFEASQFRSFAQTIAVVPGAEYQFEGFYRSDVKSTAVLKLEVADPATGNLIAATPPLALAGDWATINLRFTVPAGSDGVTIRLARENCSGASCRMAGRLSFDDLSLKPVQ